MKLIDLLVQELPKRGGWPDGAECAVQDRDTQLCFSQHANVVINAGKTDWLDGRWDGGWSNPYLDELADDYSTSIITRDQYESALAASQKVECDGTGLPPVGTECEYKWQNDRWRTGKVCYLSKHTVLMMEIFDGEESESAYGADDVVFRPLRTEADKKRDKVVESIKAMLMYDYGDDPRLNDAVILYDAIAAGKIPGVKLED